MKSTKILFPCLLLMAFGSSASVGLLNDTDIAKINKDTKSFTSELQKTGLKDFIVKKRKECKATEYKYIYCDINDDQFLQQVAYKEGFVKGFDSPYEHMTSHAFSRFSPDNKTYQDEKYNGFQDIYIKAYGAFPPKQLNSENETQKINELTQFYKFAYASAVYAKNNHFYDYRLR